MLKFMESREFGPALFERCLVADRIAAIDGFGSVPHHSHRIRSRYPGSFEISHRSPPEIVENSVSNTRLAGGSSPGGIKVSDGLSFS